MVHIEPKGHKDGMATLIGIVSWGAACGYAQYPEIYSKVSLILDWIHTETGKPITFMVLVIIYIYQFVTCNIV